MKLSQFKTHLQGLQALRLALPDGGSVPAHFHITEAGLTTKHFIDCGGTVRSQKCVNFQVWVANDTEHRLHPEKLLRIIDMAEPLFGGEDLDVEIEYQTAQTIGHFGVESDSQGFVLTSKQTDCLAQELCGIPESKPKIKLSQLVTASCCDPKKGCC